ncbi:NAD(P)-binding domain-containing protein [Hyphomicrobium sp.]|uniref:NADPH-dependent F420 reductase n=1 Tax=Hyphomicrobium sp. TaxID=82 RepID=UPI002BEA033F|nr:NAD(P)-binding domain-containing protein [Hyphomicrobium sp.]HRQ28135.1 NAD(P)-binding domain-containing protein [Hyphomicrobium sp.]
MTSHVHSLSRRQMLTLAAASGIAIGTSSLLGSSPTLANQRFKIGTIGSGNLGGAIGALWIKAGHEVMFSSRNPESLKPLVESLGPLAHAGTVEEAIAFGEEAILLAIPYQSYPEAGAAYAEALKGKVVLDAGNANRSTLFEETKENGIGITSAKYFPGARIVRAFNAANHRIFTSNANRPAPRMAVPIAGDDADAIDVAKKLVDAAGFDPLVVGGLKDADKFAMGTDGFGHILSAKELAEKLGVEVPAP